MADDDGNFDLDLSAADASSSVRPAAAPPRFRPKLKGKLVKPEPLPTPPAPAPSCNPIPVPKLKADPEAPVPMSADPSPVAPPPSAAAAAANVREMEADDEVEEDSVVREIDLFFTPAPLDDDTELYVMQYMLRPSWRPYELNERCEEVRVKPKQSKIEIDLNIDVDSENYDQEVAETLRPQKQTLSSSKSPSLTNYAVGILKGNQIHLNPVQAVLRVVPKMTNGDGVPQKRKRNVQSVEVDDGVDESIKPSTSLGKIVSLDSNISADDSEPWISLEYHPVDSAFSARYHQTMAENENKHIEFSMETSDYVTSLCPGMSTDMKKTRGPPRRLLQSLPLEQRLKRWLTEVEVNRFDALMHLAQTNSEQEVLKVLQTQADLVRGLWVTKSSLLYEGIDVHARDCILFLFSKNNSINVTQLRTYGISSDSIIRIMGPLAHTRRELKDWKFKEPPDLSFIKRYPEIVKEQECAWSTREMYLTDYLRKVGKNISIVAKNSLNPNLSKGIASNKVDADLKASRDNTASAVSKVMSAETRKFLPEALSKIFKDQKVRSINSIIRDLREFAKRLSALPKDSGKSKALVSAVTIGASAPPAELHSVISQVAVYVHGVYVLKAAENDSLRNVFIKLFRDKGPNAKLKKQEITQAATRFLRRVVTESEYNQVVDEICTSSEEGYLVLRSGD